MFEIIKYKLYLLRSHLSSLTHLSKGQKSKASNHSTYRTNSNSDHIKQNAQAVTNTQPEISPISIPDFWKSYADYLSACYEAPKINENTAFYKNGELYNVSPRNKSVPLYEDRGVAYTARYVVSDGIKYDLENAESITRIALPRFKSTGGIPSPTLNMVYILKMKANNEYRPELAVPLVFKAANLMMASEIGWGKKDYYLIIKHLWLIGEIECADYLLSELNKRLPFMTETDYLYHTTIKKELQFATENNLDLIEISPFACVCGECAKVQGRVYSISGKSSFFPKLPDEIKNHGTHCQNSFSPRYLFEKETQMTMQVYKRTKTGECKLVEVNAVKQSNRPFADNRSDFEKAEYERVKGEREKAKNTDEQYFSKERWVSEYKKHFEYQKVVELLGSKAPKNYSGYQRMKNNNTVNFQKIKEIAEQNGIAIS